MGHITSDLKRITNGWVLSMTVATVYSAQSLTIYHPTSAPLSAVVDGMMKTADDWYWAQDGEAKKALANLCKENGIAL